MDAKVALTGTQKVAVVLMNLEHAEAALVLQQFTEAEAEEIASAIVTLRSVHPDLSETALSEFHDALTLGRVGTRGGAEFATGLLESSFGSERAAGVMNRVSRSMAGRSFEFLETAEPHQIVALLDGEMAQTVALIVAHLKPSLASSVLAGLPDVLRARVAQHIATLTNATPEAIAIVSASIKSRAAAVVAPRGAAEVVGGVQPLVDIINRADAATERAILEGLDARDPHLAEEIRSRLLTFSDIVRLESRDIQLVLRAVDVAVLAIAIKGSSDLVQHAIHNNLSERNRELLAEEISLMGGVRMSQVEDARAEVVRAIRELEEAGSLTLHREDGDDIVL
ncbi:MAG TPA: flagellar motor switch protein FliG [Glaciihabitans sp.]|nr:flagellar motor switch protein FliG [Glaciihabitans sp.]